MRRALVGVLGVFGCATNPTAPALPGSVLHAPAVLPTPPVPPGTIAAGRAHTCAIDGERVVCWGGGDATPRVVPGAERAVHLAARGDTTCAALRDGRAACWTLGGAAEVVTRIADAVQVAVADASACARRRDDAVVCWWLPREDDPPPDVRVQIAADTHGLVGGGQLCTITAHGPASCADDRWVLTGHSYSNVYRNGPELLPGVLDVIAVAAGDVHECVVGRGGQVACSGLGWFGQRGDGLFASALGERLTPVRGLADATAIASGGQHTCAVRADRTVACWGLGSHGQLGDGALHDRAEPVAVAGLGDVVEVAAGSRHTCARRGTGEVVCWGDGAAGQLGPGVPPPTSELRVVAGLAGPRPIAAGDRHTCVAGDDALTCWGSPWKQQIALADDGSHTLYGMGGSCHGVVKPRRFRLELPWQLPLAMPAVELTGSARTTCVRHADDVVKCMRGRLPLVDDRDHADDCSSGERTPPPQWEVLIVNDAAQVALGRNHVCVRTHAGRVLCDGRNEHGELGSVPTEKGMTEVPGLRDVAEVASRGWHTCARRGSGEVWCWGANRDGQAGDGGHVRAPAPVRGLGSATAIATSIDQSCALDRRGVVRCVGEPHDDAADRRWTATRRTRVRVDGAATAIAGGVHEVCAIAAEGQVHCWDATEAPARPVPGLRDAVSLAVGGAHACAWRRSGDLVCWGDDEWGQLGDAAATAALHPVHAWPPM